MAERNGPRRTRERIVETSRVMFNRLGEPNVTTADIADDLGISPGNLYYHFRNKDEIVGELFGRFEERMDVEPDIAADAPGAIEDLWLYLHLMLEAIWESRFLYRNLDDLTARDRKLRESFNRIVERKLAAVARLCEGLVQARAMSATSEEIRALARNVVV